MNNFKAYKNFKTSTACNCPGNREFIQALRKLNALKYQKILECTSQAQELTSPKPFGPNMLVGKKLDFDDECEMQAPDSSNPQQLSEQEQNQEQELEQELGQEQEQGQEEEQNEPGQEEVLKNQEQQEEQEQQSKEQSECPVVECPMPNSNKTQTFSQPPIPFQYNSPMSGFNNTYFQNEIQDVSTDYSGFGALATRTIKAQQIQQQCAPCFDENINREMSYSVNPRKMQSNFGRSQVVIKLRDEAPTNCFPTNAFPREGQRNAIKRRYNEYGVLPPNASPARSPNRSQFSQQQCVNPNRTFNMNSPSRSMSRNPQRSPRPNEQTCINPNATFNMSSPNRSLSNRSPQRSPRTNGQEYINPNSTFTTSTRSPQRSPRPSELGYINPNANYNMGSPVNSFKRSSLQGPQQSNEQEYINPNASYSINVSNRSSLIGSLNTPEDADDMYNSNETCDIQDQSSAFYNNSTENEESPFHEYFHKNILLEFPGVRRKLNFDDSLQSSPDRVYIDYNRPKTIGSPRRIIPFYRRVPKNNQGNSGGNSAECN